VDWGEVPEVSAKRELKEETGLSATTCEYVGVTSATYEKNGVEKHSVYLVFSGEVNGSQFFLGPEHSIGRWVSLSEIGFMKLALNCEDIPAMIKK
jgi:8-oxo-dGTP pyrophosphatase MutT (NUDIX family)